MGFMWAFTWPNAFRACDAFIACMHGGQSSDSSESIMPNCSRLPPTSSCVLCAHCVRVVLVFAQERRGEEGNPTQCSRSPEKKS